jgi:hypothetical protein
MYVFIYLCTYTCTYASYLSLSTHTQTHPPTHTPTHTHPPTHTQVPFSPDLAQGLGGYCVPRSLSSNLDALLQAAVEDNDIPAAAVLLRYVSVSVATSVCSRQLVHVALNCR